MVMRVIYDRNKEILPDKVGATNLLVLQPRRKYRSRLVSASLKLFMSFRSKVLSTLNLKRFKSGEIEAKGHATV